MQRLTMVMRCGDAKTAENAMIYTMVGEDYSFVRMPYAQVVDALQKKTVEITNLGLEGGKLVSTNGAMKNYTLIDPMGNMANEPRAVVLNRVEANDKLLGYTIFNLNGTLQEINVAQAVELAKANKIANGKIRHTQQGDIVASIGGLYPLRVLEIKKAVVEPLNIGLLFMGSALDGSGKAHRYAGVMLDSKNAASISKVYGSLKAANEEVISKVTAAGATKEEVESLGMKVTGAAGFYGIYPIDTVLKLIKQNGNKVAFPMEKLIIACTDYTNAEHAESNVTITKDLKAAGRQEGTGKGDESLKAYTYSILNELKGITIK